MALKSRSPHEAKLARLAARVARREAAPAGSWEARKLVGVAKATVEVEAEVKASVVEAEAETEATADADPEFLALAAELAAKGIETQATTVAGLKRALKAHAKASVEA